MFNSNAYSETYKRVEMALMSGRKPEGVKNKLRTMKITKDTVERRKKIQHLLKTPVNPPQK